VLAKIRIVRAGAGRPRTKPASIGADRGTATARAASTCGDRGIRRTILEKIDSQSFACAKAHAAGGHPDSTAVQEAQHRRTSDQQTEAAPRVVAMRYGKRGYVFLGAAITAALLIWLGS
jgi:hypothetical protein